MQPIPSQRPARLRGERFAAHSIGSASKFQLAVTKTVGGLALRKAFSVTTAQPEPLTSDLSSRAGAPVRNVRAIVELERAELGRRSAVERLTDRISGAVSSNGFVILHIAWFVLWIVANRMLSKPFDAYPFNLLTMIVSLEAIILTSFVLMAQDRLTKLADRRAHLDLQINLIAEQELTAILRVMCRLAENGGIDVRTCDATIGDWLRETDVQLLAKALDRELETPVAKS